MCGILEAKVHKSAEGAMLISITHAHVPPYCIENRTSDHYIRFVQNDDNAVVFELPPMSCASYTSDSPLGKKKLRAVVIPKKKSKSHQLNEALERERDDEVASQNINSSVGESENGDQTEDTYDSDEDKTIESEFANEPLLLAVVAVNSHNIRAAASLSFVTPANTDISSVLEKFTLAAVRIA